MICNICPRKCNIDRSLKPGNCGCYDKLKINIYQLHYGEEPIISGRNGSGTIFFSGCNLHCVYCQNHTISQQLSGNEYSVEQLSDMMIHLQQLSAHNINLVTPTHFSLHIKDAIITAKNKGLQIPIIWNSNAYEETETLRELEELVDIYLPDFKYFLYENSLKYSKAKDYPEKAKAAIKEMYRQTGHMKIENEMAKSGIMLRLLILPHNLNSIEHLLKWINDELGNQTYISLMGQYYPVYNAKNYKELNRGINSKEYDFALEIMDKYGFENGFIQDINSDSSWTPEFTH